MDGYDVSARDADGADARDAGAGDAGDLMHGSAGVAREHRPVPSPFVAWILILSGVATLVPTLLLPVWRDLQADQFVERFETAETESFRKLLQNKKRHMVALRTDPAVVSRVARREFYVQTDERVVLVDAARVAPVADAVVISPPSTPAFIVWMLEWSPVQVENSVFKVFCDATARPILIGLSVSLIAVSLFLFPTRRSLMYRNTSISS